MGEPAPDNQAGASAMDKATARGDVVAGAACVAAALLGYFVLVPLAVYVPDSVAGTLDSPAVMPRIMFTALGLFGAALALAGARARMAAAAFGGRPAGDWRRSFGMLGICAAYLAMIQVVGLPAASAAGLMAALWYFGERRWRVVLPLGFVVPVLLWMFFVHVVNVSMPPALIEFGQVPDNGPGAVAGAPV